MLKKTNKKYKMISKISEILCTKNKKKIQTVKKMKKKMKKTTYQNKTMQ